MKTTDQAVEEAVALLKSADSKARIANTSALKFWVSRARKVQARVEEEQARNRFRELVSSSPELRTALEERALQVPGEAWLWFRVLDVLGKNAEGEFFARAIAAAPSLRQAAVQRLESLIREQVDAKGAKGLQDVREEDLRVLAGEGRPLERTVDLLIAAFETALRQGGNNTSLEFFLFDVCEKVHLYLRLPADERMKMPAGPFCDGATRLIVRGLQGQLTPEITTSFATLVRIRYSPPEYLKAAIGPREFTRHIPDALMPFLSQQNQ